MGEWCEQEGALDKQLLGIHHITAIAGEPQENLDFYAGLLGLRLVKLTINFDDPGTYHLYYGDGIGHPATIMTFFPWPKAPKGRKGSGQVTATSFAVPRASIPYWVERLDQHRIAHSGPSERFGEPLLSFTDPDGLGIELVATPNILRDRAYVQGPVPPEHAIHGFHSATLTEAGYQRTAALLTETMGFRLVQQEGNRFRYAAHSGDPGTIADVVCAPEERPGRVAVGTVHHIAWRTADDQQQDSWQKELVRLGHDVTPIIDRKYFHSIYYREPGGILFEIATDPPGFAIDEDPEELGSRLQLPPWLEPSRQELLAILPPIRLPAPAHQVHK
jgi:catechol 2,3-dioxygenase-like lactoylglutathione lyase family enzyme